MNYETFNVWKEKHVIKTIFVCIMSLTYQINFWTLFKWQDRQVI